jgi:hypothetical protein
VNLRKITPIFDAFPDKRMTGTTLPIGTVRVRKRERRRVARMIKVREDGPVAGRWVEYARWWWETNRGPVPAGKRVCHANGDQLDDSPSNLVLLSADDVLMLAAERDPTMLTRNAANVAKAARRHNVERAMFRRLREWLPSKWYPVDFARRVIVNTPFAERWQVYQANGIAADHGGNGRAWESASLGWPGVRIYEACILTVLHGRGWVESAALRRDVSDLRLNRGWSDVLQSTLYSSTSHLAKAGLILVRRGGRHPSHYHIARAAIELRQPPCEVVPVRGCDLDDERFAGFEKVSPGVSTPEVAA